MEELDCDLVSQESVPVILAAVVVCGDTYRLLPRCASHFNCLPFRLYGLPVSTASRRQRNATFQTARSSELAARKKAAATGCVGYISV